MKKSKVVQISVAASCLLTLASCGQIEHRPEAYEMVQLSVGTPTSVTVSCSELLGWSCEVDWSGEEVWDYARIYRNTIDDFSTATQVGRLWALFLFYDRNVTPGEQYYYWVQFEDRHTGERSAVSNSIPVCVRHPPAAVCGNTGTSSGDPSDINAETGSDHSESGRELSFPREASAGGYLPERTSLLPTELVQAPIYQDGTYLFVGMDPGSEALGLLAESGVSTQRSSTSVATPAGTQQISTVAEKNVELEQRDEWTIRHGTIEEIRTINGVVQDLERYFWNTAQVEINGTPAVIRFLQAPAIRFGGAVNADDVNRLMSVLQILNAALPSEYALEMAIGAPEPKPADLTGAIYVDFMPRTTYEAEEAANSLGTANVLYSPFTGEIDSAHVKINRIYAENGETEAAIILAHELIHALGIGHAIRGMESVMMSTPPTSDAPVTMLYLQDRQALHALYSRLDPKDLVTDLGAWDDEVTHLVGGNGYVAFGVSGANGYMEPWAYGYRSEISLAENTELSGTVEWNGLLLGFTSNDLPLSGNAQLTVQMDDLTGGAGFTELETWTVGTMPGNAGTGTTWGDGDLLYSILVTGNTFRQISGDDGRLTGIFVGAEHQGAAGTLERSDMIAAFGAMRD